MKKFVSIIALLFVGLVAILAQYTGPPDVETSKTVWEILTTIIAPILAVVFGAWKILDWTNISKPAGIGAEYAEKLALALDGLGSILEGAGMSRAGSIVKEASDPFDELGDLFAAVEKHTADGEFTKEEILNVLNEGREVVVEGKDFAMKLKKKE